MRAFLIVCLFGILFLTSCSSSKPLVYNLQGELIGEIRVGDSGASVIDAYGKPLGKVRGDIVEDESGKDLGHMIARDGEIAILTEDGMEAGTLQQSTECYGKDDTFLGKVSDGTEVNAAAGACLLLILSKQPR